MTHEVQRQMIERLVRISFLLDNLRPTEAPGVELIRMLDQEVMRLTELVRDLPEAESIVLPQPRRSDDDVASPIRH